MTVRPLTPSLRRFVTAVETALDRECDESRLVPRVGEAMRALVATDDWLDAAHTQADAQFYRQYLLYADPADRFSVVSFVWAPSQQTPIHDHTVWGVIGMLRGAERTQRYALAANGVPQPLGPPHDLLPGSVEFVSPTLGDIHRVCNALDDRVSISIHAYGANIGKVRRHVFPAEGGEPKEFISGYANA